MTTYLPSGSANRLVTAQKPRSRGRSQGNFGLEDRKRERWVAVTGQLGAENSTVQLAGVHAMADLADHWGENRQACIDVLCAYLRMPYEPDPGEEAPDPERLTFRAVREVRHTVIRVITEQLKDGAAVSWQGVDFDFTGVVFDGGDFGGAVFTAGQVSFDRAEFAGGQVSFDRAEFADAQVSFNGAVFADGEVNFGGAVFTVGQVGFDLAEFSGGEVDFGGAVFAGAQVSFSAARFSGGHVSFAGAEFSGGEVDFGAAVFSGGEVDFSFARVWSVRPVFDWPADSPPQGVKLPGKQDQPHL